MSLKNYKDSRDKLVRIESKDDKIFKKAYEELESEVQYAESEFKGFPMHRQLKQILETYTPRYKQLSN